MAISFDTTLALTSQVGFMTAVAANEDDSTGAPNQHSVQRVFTGEVSGTFPTGITWHSASSPFTFTVERPAVFKQLGPVNPVTGRLGSVPRNVWKLRLRKGVVPLEGQPPEVAMIEAKVSIPAGSEIADPENIRVMLAAFGGEFSDLSLQLGEAVVGGSL